MKFAPYRGKLGNGEHLSLEAYKYKKYNNYILIIMQHKEHVKFYSETHFFDITSVDRKLWPNKRKRRRSPLPACRR